LLLLLEMSSDIVVAGSQIYICTHPYGAIGEARGRCRGYRCRPGREL